MEESKNTCAPIVESIIFNIIDDPLVENESSKRYSQPKLSTYVYFTNGAHVYVTVLHFIQKKSANVYVIVLQLVQMFM